ncbi:MAG: hypothetical protein K2O91_00975 [Lachnospiraceae bacterium]|nr:hypothetical protein [Lachnospiraceae bacterium]
MQEHTFQINISAIINSQTDEWNFELMDTIDHAFKGSDNHLRLLGNLLVMEQYINTLRQGLAASGKTLSTGLECAYSMLWDYLNDRISPTAFEEFANDYYDCLLAYNVGTTTDAPKNFYDKYFSDADPDAYELLAIEWSSGLLMQLVSIAGGHIDFEEFEGYEQIDFYGISIMLSILENACFGLLHVSHSLDMGESLTGELLKKAMEQVHRSPLFQGIVKQVQICLHAALNAAPDTFEALHHENSQYTILPQEYASALLLE